MLSLQVDILIWFLLNEHIYVCINVLMESLMIQTLLSCGSLLGIYICVTSTARSKAPPRTSYRINYALAGSLYRCKTSK